MILHHKVVAYDDEGNPAAEKEIKTAGAPHHIELSADRTVLNADGEDISFVTATIVDKDETPCPTANNQLNFKVTPELTIKFKDKMFGKALL